MGIINGDVLKAVSKKFSAEFTKFFNETESFYQQLATVVNAKAPTVDYTWLGQFPKVREWIGDRVIKDLQAYKYSIVKKRWEATISMDRDYIIYDSIGAMKPQIQQLAQSAKEHYDELIVDLIEKNDICYDGAKFFSDQHKVVIDGSEVTFSNISTDELNQENFLKARKEMRSIKGEGGKTLKIRPNLLVVATNLEDRAIEIVKADTINGSSNITKGMADILVIDDLPDNAWMLVDSRKVIKPFILQINKKPQLVSLDKPTDYEAFMKAQYLYGVDAEHNAGYGLWQLARFSDGSGSSS